MKNTKRRKNVNKEARRAAAQHQTLDRVHQRIHEDVNSKSHTEVSRLLCNPDMPLDFLTDVQIDVIGMLLANGVSQKEVKAAAETLWAKMPNRMETILVSMAEAWNLSMEREFDNGIRPEEHRKFFEGYIDEHDHYVEGKRLVFSTDPTFVVTLLERLGFLEPDRTVKAALEDRLENAGVVPKYSTIKNGIYDGHEPDPLMTHQKKMINLSKRIIPSSRNRNANPLTSKQLRPFLKSITYISRDDENTRYKVHPSSLAAVLNGAYDESLLIDWTPDTIVQHVLKIMTDMCDDLFFNLPLKYRIHISPFIRVSNGMPEITYSTHLIIPSRGGWFFVPLSGWIMDEELGLGVANIMSELRKVQDKLSATWFKLEPFESDGHKFVRIPMCLEGSAPRNMVNVNNENVRVTVKVMPVRGQGSYYAWHYPGSENYKPVTYLVHDVGGDTSFWYIPWRGQPVQEKSILPKLINKMYEFVEDNDCIFHISALPQVKGERPTPDAWAMLKVADYGVASSGITLYQTPLPKKEKGKSLKATVNMSKWGLPVIAQEPVFDRHNSPAYTHTMTDAMILGTNAVGAGTYVFAGSVRSANKLAVKLGADLYVSTRVVGSHVNTDKVAYKMRAFKDAGWLVGEDAVFANDKAATPFVVAVDKVLDDGGHVECTVPKLDDGTVDKATIIRASLATTVVCKGYVVVS